MSQTKRGIIPPHFQKYGGVHLKPEMLSSWHQWSLKFFGNTQTLQQPYLDMTFQLDITDFFHFYESQYRHKKGRYTFFPFLVWNFYQVSKEFDDFHMRQWREEWFLLKNSPIFFPIAVGGDKRFSEGLICDVGAMEFEEFNEKYQSVVAKARDGQITLTDPKDYCCSLLFGNLPNLSFTSLTLMWERESWVGQSAFYFGKRHHSLAGVTIPLSIKFHHGPCDPYVLGLFLEKIKERGASFLKYKNC